MFCVVLGMELRPGACWPCVQPLCWPCAASTLGSAETEDQSVRPLTPSILPHPCPGWSPGGTLAWVLLKKPVWIHKMGILFCPPAWPSLAFIIRVTVTQSGQTAGSVPAWRRTWWPRCLPFHSFWEPCSSCGPGKLADAIGCLAAPVGRRAGDR